MNILYFDGGAKPNPGKGEYGYCLICNNNIIMKTDNIGDMISNNFAEYTGLIMGLQCAIEQSVKSLTIIGDSQLIINQVSKKWKCNDNTLRQLNMIAMELLNQFESVNIEWIDRDNNIAGILLEFGKVTALKRLESKL